MDASQFTEHMWNFNNYGITLTAISFGNEVGLLDLLMEQKEPVTSYQLADKANMKERYVREWLGCMVAAQIVNIDQNYDPKQDKELGNGKTNKYFIPAERHSTVKGAAKFAYGVVAWVKRFDHTKACFQKDGPWGNDYDLDDTFWKYFGGFRAQTGEKYLEDTILPIFQPDFLKRLESGGKILDLGCGTGFFSIILARKYGQSEVIGLDVSEKPLKIANDSLKKSGMTNLAFIKGNAHNLDESLHNKFDLIFFCE